MWDTRRPFGRGGGGGAPTKQQLKRTELGLNVIRLLAIAQQQGTISKVDAADVLDMKVEDAQPFLAGALE